MKLFLLVVGVFVASAGGYLYSSSKTPAHYQDSHYHSAEAAAYFNGKELVDDSQLIVVAEFLEEREERVEVNHPVTGPTGVFRDDVLRTYKVQQTLKGSHEGGTELVVWNSSGLDDTKTGILTQSFQLTEAVKGTVYVLFLIQGARDGELFWGQTGDPEKGVLEAGNIRFLSTDRYKDTARENGFQLGRGREAPFELSVAEITALVGVGPNRASTTTPIASVTGVPTPTSTAESSPATPTPPLTP